MKNKENSKDEKSLYIPTMEFYSQVLDSLRDYSVFTLDKELRINSWNAGSKNIFQYETDEIIGKDFDIIFTEEDKKNGIPSVEINNVLKLGKAHDNRWHIRKDKSLFYASGLVFPLTDSEGEFLGYVKILRDITERKKAEDALANYVKELEELNTHKESVLAIVSHDLRSPLTGIIGSVEFLKSNFKEMDPDDTEEMLELVYLSSKEELDMLDNLVEWARVRFATEVCSPAKLELVLFVDKVFDTLGEFAAKNNTSLDYDIEENAYVYADRKMLLSILQNIVSNAIKHTHNGTITVSAKKTEGKMLICVRDTGTGMSEVVKKNLFTPQMASLSQTRKNNKGAGIGLLLVKGFLEKSGGEIWVESIEGKGSSFYFTLPIDEVEN